MEPLLVIVYGVSAIEEKQKPREQLDALVTDGSAPLTRKIVRFKCRLYMIDAFMQS